MTPPSISLPARRPADFDLRPRPERPKPHAFRLALRLLSLLVVPTPAPAVETLWIGGPTGFWHRPEAWSGARPGSGIDALIRADATVEIGPDAPDETLVVDRLDLGPSDTGTPRLRLVGLGDRALHVTQTALLDGAAVLEIDTSHCVIEGAQEGHLNFRSGTIRIRDGQLSTRASATLRVGRTGDGLLRIEGGAVRAAADLTLGGLPGSSGTLELVSGTVEAHGILRVADDPASRGTLRILGGSLTATSDTARIGDDGQGLLEIEAGQATFADVSVGRDATSEGTLRVSGGRCLAGDVSLGRLTGAHGTAWISGGEMLVPDDTLYLGREGHGELRLEGGRIVASNLVVASGTAATGILHLTAGTLQVRRLTANSPNASLRFEGGRLESHASETGGQPFQVGDGVRPATLLLHPGTHRFPGGLVIAAMATLEGTGTVVGTVTVLSGGLDRRSNPGRVPNPPRLSLTLRDGVRRLSLPTEPGVVYTLEFRPSFDTPWSVLHRAPGTGSTLTVDDPDGGAPSRIYRAMAQ